MKKLTSLLLAITLSFILISCGTSSSSSDVASVPFSAFNKAGVERIPVNLSNQQTEELASLLQFSKWEEVPLLECGYIVETFIIDDKNTSIYLIGNGNIFTKNAESVSHLYTLPLEVYDGLNNAIIQIVNDSFKSENSALTEEIVKFNNIILEDYPEDEYRVDFSNTAYTSVSKEKLLELLDISSWQLYIGDYSKIYRLDEFPIRFFKIEYEYPDCLTVGKIDDAYFIKCQFNEGMGGQQNFIIPQTVYQNIKNFRDNLM